MSLQTTFIVSILAIGISLAVGLFYDNGYIFKGNTDKKGKKAMDVVFLVVWVAASIIVYVQGVFEDAPANAGMQFFWNSVKNTGIVASIFGLACLAVMMGVGGGLIGAIVYFPISSLMKKNKS